MKFTGEMANIAESCGEEVARELCMRLGGVYIYIPINAEPSGVLDRLSDDAREALCTHFAGATFYVPKHSSARSPEETLEAIEELLRLGYTTQQISLELGISQPHVFRLRRNAGAPKVSNLKDPRQLGFEDLL